MKKACLFLNPRLLSKSKDCQDMIDVSKTSRLENVRGARNTLFPPSWKLYARAQSSLGENEKCPFPHSLSGLCVAKSVRIAGCRQ